MVMLCEHCENVIGTLEHHGNVRKKHENPLCNTRQIFYPERLWTHKCFQQITNHHPSDLWQVEEHRPYTQCPGYAFVTCMKSGISIHQRR
jgi:hypothetical protein